MRPARADAGSIQSGEAAYGRGAEGHGRPPRRTGEDRPYTFERLLSPGESRGFPRSNTIPPAPGYPGAGVG